MSDRPSATRPPQRTTLPRGGVRVGEERITGSEYQARPTEKSNPPPAVPVSTVKPDSSERVTAKMEEIPDLLRPDRHLEGVVVGNRYQLLRSVARGGMGEVYIGRHLNLDQEVAIKVMLADVAMVPDYAKRFHREARAMSLLNHRNIVRVLDYGLEQGMPYIVMELLQGCSVGTWLHQSQLPALADVHDIMLQLFDAFEAAHGAGIVHRDLKPDNIFLSEQTDGMRLVKILDFGLARIDGPAARGTTVTQANMVSGTPEYMSPEQCRSLSVTTAADFYAMGCVLTEMLQGFPPFDGPSHADIMTKQMFVAPPPLQRPTLLEPIPPLLERLRLDLLAKSPRRRPPDVASLRARYLDAIDMQQNVRQLPGRKQPEPLGERAARQQRWTDPAPAASVRGAEQKQRRIGLLRLAQGEMGVDDACVVGLAAGGTETVLFTPANRPEEVDVVVLDAGNRIDDACSWLAQVWPDVKRRRLARPVVCAQRVDADILNRLIAAGAGDVVGYPVEVVVLARKIGRMIRKASRQRRGRTQ